MLENKRLIIFDLDGTLLDSVGVWNQIDEEMIKTLGGTIEEGLDLGKRRDKALASFNKDQDAYLEYCGYLGQLYGSSLSKEELKNLRYSIASRLLKDKVDYKPNAEDVLKYLKAKGIKMVIGSTTNDYTVEVYKHENQNIISKAPFDEYFERIYSKGSVQELKPSPAVHYKIMEDFGLKPEECLIIEDSVIGLKAGTAAGIDTIAMYDKYSESSRDEIDTLAKYKFNNFKELLDALKAELGE